MWIFKINLNFLLNFGCDEERAEKLIELFENMLVNIVILVEKYFYIPTILIF